MPAVVALDCGSRISVCLVLPRLLGFVLYHSLGSFIFNQPFSLTCQRGKLRNRHLFGVYFFNVGRAVYFPIRIPGKNTLHPRLRDTLVTVHGCRGVVSTNSMIFTVRTRGDEYHIHGNLVVRYSAGYFQNSWLSP